MEITFVDLSYKVRQSVCVKKQSHKGKHTGWFYIFYAIKIGVWNVKRCKEYITSGKYNLYLDDSTNMKQYLITNHFTPLHAMLET